MPCHFQSCCLSAMKMNVACPRLSHSHVCEPVYRQQLAADPVGQVQGGCEWRGRGMRGTSQGAGGVWVSLGGQRGRAGTDWNRAPTSSPEQGQHKCQEDARYEHPQSSLQPLPQALCHSTEGHLVCDSCSPPWGQESRHQTCQPNTSGRLGRWCKVAITYGPSKAQPVQGEDHMRWQHSTLCSCTLLKGPGKLDGWEEQR